MPVNEELGHRMQMRGLIYIFTLIYVDLEPMRGGGAAKLIPSVRIESY